MTRENPSEPTPPPVPHDAPPPASEDLGHDDHHGDFADSGDRDDRGRRQRRPRVDNFEKLKVWQEAHALTLKIFTITPHLPAEQQAGLALQIEQAAIAVPKSIAEGFKRRGPRNKAHFYNIAQTQVEALRYYFILCRDLGYQIDYDDLAQRAEQIGRMLDGLVRSMMRS